MHYLVPWVSLHLEVLVTFALAKAKCFRVQSHKRDTLRRVHRRRAELENMSDELIDYHNVIQTYVTSLDSHLVVVVRMRSRSFLSWVGMRFSASQ